MGTEPSEHHHTQHSLNSQDELPLANEIYASTLGTKKWERL